MCGIFGYITSKKSNFLSKELNNFTNKLYQLSESRGRESSGIAVKSPHTKKISILKDALPASKFIEGAKYKKLLRENIPAGKLTQEISLIAHTRLVTNGCQYNNENNMPIYNESIAAVHNGIITNIQELWDIHQDLNHRLDVDSEFITSYIQKDVKNSSSLVGATQKLFHEINGTASIALLFSNFDEFVLASNNTSLYYYLNKEKGILAFSSEQFILSQAVTSLLGNTTESEIKRTKPFSGLLIKKDLSIDEFTYEAGTKINIEKNSKSKSIFHIHNISKKEIPLGPTNLNTQTKVSQAEKVIEFNLESIKKLKRCTKCILPETFPFIRFNSVGVCNYCENYKVKKQGSREQEFKAMMNKFKRGNNQPDCIVPFSGGRDSSFGLHYIVHDLGMKPITYTYDWGMVTDLSRRNIARVCGKLGIENIIVSADIKYKRENIRKNLEAWLKKPVLGMIPLLMAGDKHFYYFVNQVKKQTGISLNIWSGNQLENTDFKSGFCGVAPAFEKKHPDSLPIKNQITMICFYLYNFLRNPSYLNKSLVDTASSYWSYYIEPRSDFYQLYDWIKWDEQLIEDTLLNRYDWEISPDTTSTWRIGDGTAAFYNYVYYTVTASVR